MTMKSLLKINENTTADDIRTAVAAGLDPNERDRGGWTPLHYAHNAEQTNALLAARANPNARADSGLMPLHCAHDAAQTQALLAAGADPNARAGLTGGQPLHYARNAEQTQALIAAGAEVPDGLDDERRAWVSMVQAQNALKGSAQSEAAPAEDSPLATLLRHRGRNSRARS